MKVRVSLFGTLGQDFPNHQPSQGMEVELVDGATVVDLLARLGLSESRRPVVITEGRVLKADEVLQPGVLVKVMQAIGGG